MNKILIATLAAFAIASPALAEGDATLGEKAFSQCQTCHVVVDDAGTTIAGKKGKIGPNLYRVIGRQAGSLEGFKYGNSMKQAGEKGLIWDEATFVEYVQGPADFLKSYLDDKKAKAKMGFKVKSAEDAANLYAFLVSLAPAEDAADAAPAVNN